jgi:hypothetical protein
MARAWILVLVALSGIACSEDEEPDSVAGEWASEEANEDGGTTERRLTLNADGTGERVFVATGARAGTVIASAQWQRSGQTYDILLYCESVNGSTASCSGIPALYMACTLDASANTLTCIADGEPVIYTRVV